MTLSTSLSVRSRREPILDGRLLKNQIWATGVARSMCPGLSRLTLDGTTSTRHFSQTTPLSFPHVRVIVSPLQVKIKNRHPATFFLVLFQKLDVKPQAFEFRY